MKSFYFSTCFFAFFTILNAKEVKTNCLEKEKAIALLETADDLLSKAKFYFPSCEQGTNSTNKSDCEGKKPLAYIEISQKLISDVREHFPTCISRDVIIHYEKSNDCSEILTSGRKESGVYTIWPSESNSTGKSLQVYCDMETDGGGWTLIQRRGKFPVQQDFQQNWENYKNGFGNITQEFWLGNENIRVLCHKGCEIRFDLQDKNGVKGFAFYRNFSLSRSNYTIDISGYKGNTGDGMQYYNKLQFATIDRDTGKYAARFQGGWWHGGSNQCNLNGIYGPGRTFDESVHWYQWRIYDNLASVEIKVRKH